MKLTQIDKTRDVAIDFGDGDVLNVTYNASKLTPRLESELSGASDSEQMVDILLLLVTAWDLEDGEPSETVPLDKETLSGLPLLVLATAVRAIAQDIGAAVRTEGKA